MTHSAWIDCPMVRPGDDKTEYVKPVTCRYCREHLRLPAIVETEAADVLRQEGQSE